VVDLVIIAVVVVNGLIFYRRAQRAELAQPERGDEPRRIAIGFVAWLAPLALLSLIGNAFHLTGLSIPPRHGDHATAWDWFATAAIMVVLLRGTIWIWRDGAAMLARNSDVLFGIRGASPRSVRVQWTVMMLMATAVACLRLWPDAG
jgi:hypothetical protein